MADLPAGHCRFCGTAMKHVFADLGMSPVSNDFRRPDQWNQPEPFFPLRVYVCGSCKLVQIQDFHRPDALFRSDYSYFSSFSSLWLDHCRAFVDTAMSRFDLGPSSKVVELASNDGYLLQYFVAKAVPVLGVEPAANCAAAARQRGVPTMEMFFGASAAAALREQGHAADLIVANNVLAHVPDINDFIAGIVLLLKPDGVISFEFPHLLRLIEGSQFDTIYHEHYSYLSLLAVERILTRHGLAVFDVEEVPTHGGSLRVMARRSGGNGDALPGLVKVRTDEQAAGFDGLDAYTGFDHRMRRVKRDLLTFLIGAKEAGKSVVGYGAPAKGNTLLNYCGIRGDFLDYTVDRNPYKQGMVLPGTGIPIYAPERITETRPDYVLILPWNLKDEIIAKTQEIRRWGGQFVVPIPKVQVL